jgi:aspartate/methionine/tyrosine aminotransferase
MGNILGKCFLVFFCLKGQQSFETSVIKKRGIFCLNNAIQTSSIKSTLDSAADTISVSIDRIPAQIPAESVWTVFGELAAKTDASNLGQGFPDWDPPQFLLDSLRAAVDTKYHQYTRPAGHPPLVELLAAKYSEHLDRTVDPFNEVAVTVGASQALYLALTLFLKANEEVVLFEPFFDLYGKQIKLTGAIPKYVSLGGRCATASDPWALDIETLKK